MGFFGMICQSLHHRINMDNNNALIHGNIHGDVKIWYVGIFFALAGAIMGLLVPWIITPVPGQDDILTIGKVVDYAYDEDDAKAEMYTYQTTDGEHRSQNGIWSSSPAYKIGDSIEVYYSESNPDKSWIKNDKNLIIVNYILQGLGIYFAFLGLGTIILKLRGSENVKIEVLIGALAALSYGIPAISALPIIYYAFLTRPNILFESTVTALPMETLVIGAVFTVTGIMDLIATFFMLRHFKKTGSNTMSFSG